jgi:hypothetical protein
MMPPHITTRTAACACGQLRVTCEGEPALLAACHCTACQRRTGSAFGVSAYFPRARVKAIEGSSKVFVRTSDAGRQLRLHFCPECGTTLFWEAEFRPGDLGVAAGAFAEPGALPAPAVVVWAEHIWAWVPLPEGARVLPRQCDPAARA